MWSISSGSTGSSLCHLSYLKRQLLRSLDPRLFALDAVASSLAITLSEKSSDILQVVKLNRSKIIIELVFILHGKRKGGGGEMSPKRI